MVTGRIRNRDISNCGLPSCQHPTDETADLPGCQAARPPICTFVNPPSCRPADLHGLEVAGRRAACRWPSPPPPCLWKLAAERSSGRAVEPRAVRLLPACLLGHRSAADLHGRNPDWPPGCSPIRTAGKPLDAGPPETSRLRQPSGCFVTITLWTPVAGPNWCLPCLVRRQRLPALPGLLRGPPRAPCGRDAFALPRTSRAPCRPSYASWWAVGLAASAKRRLP